MILVPLPYKLYGFFCLCLDMEHLLYKSKSGRTGYRLFSFSGGTFLRGVQGNPNYFPILVQGDAVHGIGSN